MPRLTPHFAGSILFVGESTESCEILKQTYRERGYQVVSQNSASEAQHSAPQRFNLVIADVELSDGSGFELLKSIRAQDPAPDVILTSPNPSVDESERARLAGAAYYLPQPFAPDKAVSSIESILNRRAETASGVFGGSVIPLPETNRSSTPQRRPMALAKPCTTKSGPPMIGQSTVIKNLFKIINRIAVKDSSVLVTGATGTGKELISRAIHAQSLRRDGPFVDLNCSAIPDTLIEAELFGHQRGTFTGAHETRRGLFEEASGGTLFLDEVDALNLQAQAKLLRVLQERSVRRVGGRENIPINVRIISATNRDLMACVSDGSFRVDLLYRLRVIPLHVPELSKRADDIRLLAKFFLQRHCERYGGSPHYLSAEASDMLMSYSWPGNVRELENAMEFAAAIAVNEELTPADLPPEVCRNDSVQTGNWITELTGNESLAEIERRYILKVFNGSGQHQIKTASVLGIDRRTLYRKLRQFGALEDVHGRPARVY
jgi:DNA-binding NtrC family response regulator